jgi:hypothetical protein
MKYEDTINGIKVMVTRYPAATRELPCNEASPQHISYQDGSYKIRAQFEWWELNHAD